MHTQATEFDCCCSVPQGKKGELQKMYEDWPFFAATIDLIEMILAKADMRIAALYDDVLVDDAAEKKLGSELRQKFVDTVRAVLEVGHWPGNRLVRHQGTSYCLIKPSSGGVAWKLGVSYVILCCMLAVLLSVLAVLFTGLAHTTVCLLGHVACVLTWFDSNNDVSPSHSGHWSSLLAGY